MTPEGKVVALIKKRIKEAGGEVRKCAWENCRGAPDLLVMLPGIHAWIEAKTETGKLGPHQAREHTRMTTRRLQGVRGFWRGSGAGPGEPPDLCLPLRSRGTICVSSIPGRTSRE